MATMNNPNITLSFPPLPFLGTHFVQCIICGLIDGLPGVVCSIVQERGSSYNLVNRFLKCQSDSPGAWQLHRIDEHPHLHGGTYNPY